MVKGKKKSGKPKMLIKTRREKRLLKYGILGDLDCKDIPLREFYLPIEEQLRMLTDAFPDNPFYQNLKQNTSRLSKKQISCIVRDFKKKIQFKKAKEI